MSYLPLPSVDYLRECLTYDEATGVLRWKVRPLSHFPSESIMKMWNAQNANCEAGTIMNKRYRSIKLNSYLYLAHRVIFKLMTGDDPPDQIDHRNRQRADNRWENLRASTNRQNGFNVVARKGNQLGLKGVHFCTKYKKFAAQIKLPEKRKWLGYFKTAEEAHEAYRLAAERLHGQFINLGHKETYEL